MHCPNCGQQQVSNDTKFCSRCGMPLGLVSEVLAHGGFLPQLAELNNRKQPFWTKKNGVVGSVLWFIVFSMLLPAIFGILDAPDPLVAIPAVIGFFGSVIALILSLVFLPSSKSSFRPQPPMMAGTAASPAAFYTPNQQQALPPQQSIPVSNYAPPGAGSWRGNTNDLEPSSITESTTRLLTKEDKIN